jgi:hypothetical protein
MLRASIALALAVAAAACTKSAPTQPSTESAAVAAADLTASIVAPRPLSPVNDAQIRNVDQPVVLVVQNAVSTQAGVTYTFEVATDSGFSAKVQTKDGVAEGSGGQTRVTLDALTPARDYYWHARATSGGTTGLFGAVYKFTVGPAVTVNAPSPIAPLTNAQTGVRPTLRVTNATRTGPVGAITYRFELSTAATFATTVASATVAEGINETGYTPPLDLTLGTLYFWRATAIDASNGVTSAASAVQSFTPVDALWPGQQPPGTKGHAFQGPGWDKQSVVSFTGVRFDSPPIDEARIFDLLDRGFDPQGAIDWMNSHGYSTPAVWYPSVLAIGFQWTYVAYIDGRWELVFRVGA